MQQIKNGKSVNNTTPLYYEQKLIKSIATMHITQKSI